MCTYKILSRSKNRYIILSNECDHYQVAFGTTGVSFDELEFMDFCDNVIALKNRTFCNGFEDEKRIKVNLFSKSTMMILNYKKLKGLYNLIC